MDVVKVILVLAYSWSSSGTPFCLIVKRSSKTMDFNVRIENYVAALGVA